MVDRADLRIGDARCVTRADQDAYRRDAVNPTVKLASRLSYGRNACARTRYYEIRRINAMLGNEGRAGVGRGALFPFSSKAEQPASPLPPKVPRVSRAASTPDFPAISNHIPFVRIEEHNKIQNNKLTVKNAN